MITMNTTSTEWADCTITIIITGLNAEKATSSQGIEPATLHSPSLGEQHFLALFFRHIQRPGEVAEW